MKAPRFIERHSWRILLLLAVIGLGLAGCATEPENEDSKPWNSTEGWQNGNIPSMMTQPR